MSDSVFFDYDKFKNLPEYFDGHYSVHVGRSSIDLLVCNNKKSRETLLVCFSGAVPDRKSKSPPFFSGKKISDDLGLSLVSFSDPTLNKSNECGLGWYLGNSDFKSLPEKISEIIRLISVSNNKKRKVILFGGSGGGFAALSVSLLLKDLNCSCFVWNPQINVSSYYESFVIKYLETAFPDTQFLPNDVHGKELLYQSLSSNNLVHDLSQFQPSLFGNCLYVQNIHDRHYAVQLRPYFNRFDWERVSNNAFSSGKMTVFIADWGSGHIPPPKKVILKILSMFHRGVSSSNIGLYLSKKINTSKKLASFNADRNQLSGTEMTFELVGEGRSAYLEVIFPDFDFCEGIEYAVYFFKKRRRVHVAWYQDDPIFKMPDDHVDAVQLFARDSWSNVISNWINIE